MADESPKRCLNTGDHSLEATRENLLQASKYNHLRGTVNELMIKEEMEIQDVHNALPCSLDALEEQNDFYVRGSSKLLAEVAHAKSIPQGQRMLISKKYLDTLGNEGKYETHPNGGEMIVEHSEGFKKFYV